MKPIQRLLAIAMALLLVVAALLLVAQEAQATPDWTLQELEIGYQAVADG